MQRGFTLLALAALFISTFSTPLKAQTQLAAGDLLFTLLNMEGNNDDAFGFVLLTDVEAGTVVHITDKEYETGVGFEEFEGVLTITFDVPFGCGNEIMITDQDPATAEYVFGASLPGISISPNVDNGFQLSTAGETLIAFRGDDLTNPCNDCFITALANTGVGFGEDATGSGDLPPGLTVGTNAMAMSASPDDSEWDNIKYDCSTTQADPDVLRTELTTTTNWMVDDAAPFPVIPCEPAFGCSSVCLPSVINGITVVDCPQNPGEAVTLMVDGELNGGGQWEWTGLGDDCASAPTNVIGETAEIQFAQPDNTFYVRATGGCLTEIVCLPYNAAQLLEIASFTAPTLDIICNNSGLIEGLSGGLPNGGVYSGEGVIDNGDGVTFDFDPSLAGLGTVAVTYTSDGACISSATAEIEVVQSPVISFILTEDDISVEAGLQTGLGGATPEGGVYSGSGVTDDGNGMTFTFDPAVAGIGQTEVTYSFTDGDTGCSNDVSSNLTVIDATVMGDECVDATDLNDLFGQNVDEPQTSALFTNVDATTGDNDPAEGFECFGEPDGGGASPELNNTLWFTFTGDGEIYFITTIECSATDFIDDGDTQIAIYSGACDALVAVDCNEDAAGVDPAGPYPAGLEFATEDGVEYRMLIDGFSFEGAVSDGEFCVEVTRLMPEPPAGNVCTDGTDINPLFGQGIGNAQTSALFNNDDATTEASDPEFGFDCFGEPDGGGGSPELNRTLWYTFTGDGETYSIKTVECSATDYIDDADTQIALYSGDCENLEAVLCNDDSPGATQGDFFSEITVETVAGVEYRMIVDGFGGDFPADGEFCLEVNQLTNVAVKEISNTSIEVFPNPTNGQINISGLQPERITVFDHTGRRVMDVEQGGNVLEIDGLPAGLYLLKMYAGEEVYSAKVVKE